jgi:LPXTG-motif cell wall-anchored protein
VAVRKRVIAAIVTTVLLVLVAPSTVFASTLFTGNSNDNDHVDTQTATELAQTGAAFVPMLVAAGIALAIAGLAVIIVHRRVTRLDG